MGVADPISRRAVTPATRFHLFSGTKLYTATALMRLVELGTVRLDESVEDHLPDLTLRHPVTLRQLASHASGLPDTLRAFLATHESAGPTARAALSRYRTDGGRRPGGRAAYRNVNFAILGALIAACTESSFPAAMAGLVLEPLGVRPTFGVGTARDDQDAVGSVPRFSLMKPLLRVLDPKAAGRLWGKTVGGLTTLRPFGLDTAAIGGLSGTAMDFLPLLKEMLDPADGLLRAASKTEMLSVQTVGRAGIVSREGVGLAWKLGRVDGTEFWNHEGGGPGFCSETRIYPADGLGVVVLMNRSQTPRLSRVAHAICEHVRRAS